MKTSRYIRSINKTLIDIYPMAHLILLFISGEYRQCSNSTQELHHHSGFTVSGQLNGLNLGELTRPAGGLQFNEIVAMILIPMPCNSR